jgi:hypothetical protein
MTFTDELTACRDSGFQHWIGLNPKIRPPSVKHRREMRGKVEKRRCPFVNSLRLQRAVDIVFTMPRSAILDAPGVSHHVSIRGIECRKIFQRPLKNVHFLSFP